MSCLTSQVQAPLVLNALVDAVASEQLDMVEKALLALREWLQAPPVPPEAHSERRQHGGDDAKDDDLGPAAATIPANVAAVRARGRVLEAARARLLRERQLGDSDADEYLGEVEEVLGQVVALVEHLPLSPHVNDEL